ncbi:hypothetical protein JFU48_25335 [Pseudomonas sp. TH49]|uniref:hypothetical protein n=1 Tax=Pseudomonas sp. TH49 TaxID=2796413 RepID=UPI001911F398|nr:hypothetical protein [Pseudomonas sp. TH49]MBK5344687.1 hypothetical protein [Pseudomonas sp. TH49]
MKKLLGLFLLAVSGVTLALPAAEQPTPQAKANESSYSQSLAADGSDRTPQGRMA